MTKFIKATTIAALAGSANAFSCPDATSWPTFDRTACSETAPTVIVSMNLRASADTSSASAVADQAEFLFESYRREFDIEFEDAAEYMKRKAIFATNLASIEAHNASGATWTQAVNEFAHLSGDEWKSMYASGFVQSDEKVEASLGTHVVVGDAADSVDWNAKGAVTAVKNQGVCGSCWTFSATGAVEGAYQIAGNTLTNFSQEQILDCDKGGNGCGGGMMDQAYKFYESDSVGGVCSANDYPYEEAQTQEGSPLADSCTTTCKPVTTVTGFTDVDKTEEAMKSAVSQQPVSVAIEADQSAFHFYKSGVMTGTCGTKLDHGVLVTGYGTDSSGGDYWTIKNSWGTTWGESGFIRIQRGNYQEGGQCGVLMMASYPTVGN